MAANEVSEMLLERTAQAMLSGDFEGFAHCFALPHLIDTPDKKMTLNTRDALYDLFRQMVQGYKSRNVTALIRYCEVAEFRAPDRVEATHISHVMSNHQRVIDPFHTFSVIQFIDNRWQLTSSQYAVDAQSHISAALHGTIDCKTALAPQHADIGI